MTAADYIFLAVLAASGIFALIRGFTLELLEIVAFLAAGLIALLLFPVAKPLVANMLPEGIVGTLIIGGVIFLIALAPLWLIGDAMAKKVRGSQVGMIDRTVGFGYGIVRGVFVMAIAYIIYTGGFSAKRDQPDWIRQARFLPLVEKTADLIMSIAPDQSAIVDGFAKPVVAAEKKSDASTGTGYGQKDRSELDRLSEQAGR